MSEQVVAALVYGWVLQFVKARKGVPTWVVQVLTVLMAGVVYALWIASPNAQNWRAWLTAVVAWGVQALGWSSVAAATGVAPKTDSIH